MTRAQLHAAFDAPLLRASEDLAEMLPEVARFRWDDGAVPTDYTVHTLTVEQGSQCLAFEVDHETLMNRDEEYAAFIERVVAAACGCGGAAPTKH